MFPTRFALSPVVLVLAAFALPAQDFYVDAENGSNANSGTFNSPWKTVHFALTGPHSLPADAVIHLMGTDTVDYSPANGEVFPWRLSRGISLVADAAGSGSNHVVDGEHGGQTLVEFDPRQPASGSIRGLSFRNAARGINVEPAPGVAHSPRIHECSFWMLSLEAVRVFATAGAEASPTIEMNQISECGYANAASLSIEQQSSGSGAGTVWNNTIEDDPLLELSTGGIYVKGGGSGGTASVGSLLRIIGNLLRGCRDDGILVEDSAPITLSYNDVRGSGGSGVRIAGRSSEIQVISNRLQDNQGCGLRDESCNGTWCSDNLIADNLSHGIELTAGTPGAPPIYFGNTVVNNAGNGVRSALRAPARPYLTNSIVWGNAGGGADILGLAEGHYRSCLIGVGGSTAYGNLAADPELDSAYRLSSTSPCIDAGDDQWVNSSTDLDGDPRVLNGDFVGGPRVDMGADEWAAGSLSTSAGAGGSASIQVDGPPGAQFLLYAALEEAAGSSAARAGVRDPVFGTILLDLARLVGAGPIAVGVIGPGTSATVQAPCGAVPARSGGRLSVQAFLLDVGGQGQATNAATLAIDPS